MSKDRPTVSTHVLDLASGSPRAGVRVVLRRPAGDGGAPIVGEGVTDGDGRIRDLLGDGTLAPGSYRLEFALDPGGFFSGITLDLMVEDASRGYHVPLLVSPFGLTTYRGS